MKALLFHPPFELRLEIDGEEFRQGDAIPCKLRLHNRANDPQTLASPQLALAFAQTKKVKQKEEGAFTILAGQQSEQTPSEPKTLEAGETLEVTSTFQLDRNAPITEKSQSLYVVFGLEETIRGHLQLNVAPHEELEGIIGIFETSFQFLLKGIKSKKGSLVATFKAPEGPGYRALSQLELTLRFIDTTVELVYLFKVERLEASAQSLAVQKQKLEHRQPLERKEYMSPAGYVDPDLIEPKIREALALVTSKFS